MILTMQVETMIERTFVMRIDAPDGHYLELNFDKLRDDVLHMKTQDKTLYAKSYKNVALDDLIGIIPEMSVESAKEIREQIKYVFEALEK